jgi:hypothetical protein
MNQLKIISILYFVLAAFSILMLCFIPIHYHIMKTFMSMEIPNQAGQPNPAIVFQQMKDVMIIIYLISAIFSTIFAILNIVTGICFMKRKARTLAIIGSGAACLVFPLGTALGVFSLITLFKDEVIEEFY